MITTLVYRDSRFVARNPPVETLPALLSERATMVWVNLSEPSPEETRLILEETFAFHPLVIEDCVTENALPKLEAYESYLLCIMHAVDYSKTDAFTTTELDLILGRNFLVTFHKKPLRPVQTALERYGRSPATTVRGPDRFAHTLLDSIVDAYKPTLQELRRDLEAIEDAVLKGDRINREALFTDVVALRKDLAQIRRIARPQHGIILELAQGRNPMIRKVIVPYLRDLAEELARIEQQAVTWAEQLILTFRVYLNKSNHEANEGIRLLTALTALTIPPLLIGGWYGMNFEHMFELDPAFSYPLAFIVTLLSTSGMYALLRRKRWL